MRCLIMQQRISIQSRKFQLIYYERCIQHIFFRLVRLKVEQFKKPSLFKIYFDLTSSPNFTTIITVLPGTTFYGDKRLRVVYKGHVGGFLWVFFFLSLWFNIWSLWCRRFFPLSHSTNLVGRWSCKNFYYFRSNMTVDKLWKVSFLVWHSQVGI